MATESPAPHAERLAALRARLGELGLDGFVLARTDPYLGEFIPDSEQLLAWLSGFTGSAGWAAVLADRAALVVDGRYSVQAQQEVDTNAWEIVDDPETGVAEWLANRAPAGGRIGADPWRYSAKGFRDLAHNLAAAGAELVPVAENPVLALWTDRPAPPAAPVASHPLAFTGEPAADKLARLAQQLADKRVAALVVAQPTALAWLLNIRGGDVAYTPVALSYGVLHRDGRLDWYVDAGKVSAGLLAELPEAVARRDPEAFGGELDKLGGGQRVWLDPALTPAAVTQRLEAAGAALHEAGDPVIAAKAQKTDAELGGARSAHERDGAALVRFLAEVKHAVAEGDGLTERDAAARLHAQRSAVSGFAGPSFGTISAADGHAAVVHYSATPASDAPIAPASVYLVDSGGQFPDGTTDVTRTLVFQPASRDVAELYTRVLKAHIAVATALVPHNAPGSQLDALARQHLWAAGLDYDHGTGHGVGSYLAVHEGPQRVAKTGTAGLKAGMLISNEPGFYQAGRLGIRLENLLAIRPVPADELPAGADSSRRWLRFETLTLAPFEPQAIAVDLLSDGERAWLNGYHARVRETLLPQLDPADAAWLRRQTQPL